MNPRIDGIELMLISDNFYGVVATKDFRNEEIVEVCPVIPINEKDQYFVRETEIKNLCTEHDGKLYLVGGYGCAYLNNKTPNVIYELDEERGNMTIISNREIAKRELIYLERKIFWNFDEDLHFFKKLPFYSNGLEIRESNGRGLGVFTTKDFKKGDFVEICELYYLDKWDSYLLSLTKLENYLYSFGKKNQKFGWPIGYAGFYNHPNLGHGEKANVNPWKKIKGIDENHIAVKAEMDIPSGNEILFDYQKGFKKKNLGFIVV